MMLAEGDGIPDWRLIDYKEDTCSVWYAFQAREYAGEQVD